MNQKKVKSAQDWLTEPTDDQLLEDIDDLPKTWLDGVRRWFRSAILQPVFKMGSYDLVSGRFKLNSDTYHVVAYDATSQQQTNFTVTAGQEWEILGLSYQNGTRATAMQLIINSGGVAYTYYISASVAAAQRVNLVGDGINAATSGGAGTKGLRLTGGNVISARSVTFVAADATVATLIYRRLA